MVPSSPSLLFLSTNRLHFERVLPQRLPAGVVGNLVYLFCRNCDLLGDCEALRYPICQQDGGVQWVYDHYTLVRAPLLYWSRSGPFDPIHNRVALHWSFPGKHLSALDYTFLHTGKVDQAKVPSKIGLGQEGCNPRGRPATTIAGWSAAIFVVVQDRWT